MRSLESILDERGIRYVRVEKKFDGIGKAYYAVVIPRNTDTTRMPLKHDDGLFIYTEQDKTPPLVAKEGPRIDERPPARPMAFANRVKWHEPPTKVPDLYNVALMGDYPGRRVKMAEKTTDKDGKQVWRVLVANATSSWQLFSPSEVVVLGRAKKKGDTARVPPL